MIDRLITFRKILDDLITFVVSLDVHDRNVYIYAMNRHTGEVFMDDNIHEPIGKIPGVLSRLHLDPSRTMIIYEAGNSGFYPYRLLTKHGYHCSVIAPSSIPHCGKGQKTDRDDAHDNMHYYLSGLLRIVDIPDHAAEMAREMMRYRYQVMCKVSKTKQMILSFTHRHGHLFTGTKTNWTKKHREWLHTEPMSEDLRVVLDMRLAELSMAEENLKRLDEQLEKIVTTRPLFSTRYNLYRQMQGFGPVNAMYMTFEGGDLCRFRHPAALMNYVGLVPGKNASGQSDPARHITKAGNFFIRLALVSAARAYGKSKDVEQYLEKPVTTDDPLAVFNHKTVTRLSYRFRYLAARKKHRNKIRCAIARELCGFCWELMNTVSPQLELRKAA